MMKQSEDKKIEKLQTMIFTGILVAVFVLLIRLVWPDGCFYGSTTDWYNQHVTLAETIRNVCMQERTLAPSWISLGGGSNGFQFAYYGYYRPDIIIGCLFPQIPMTVLIPVYALSSYLAAVLLMQLWLRMKGMTPYAAFFGSMLFLLGRLFFPDTPADHVCKLYAVFIAGIDFPEKTQICTDEHQPDTDLSAQLLLCYSLSGSDRLVCSWNAP